MICEHGSLKRKCEICYLNEEINELRQALLDIKGILPKGGSKHGRPDYVTIVSNDKVKLFYDIIEKALGEQ